MAVGVDPGGARLEGGGLGPDALELGEHLGVLAAGGSVVGQSQLLVEGLELGAHRGGASSSDERLLELRGDLLEGGARVAELGRLVGADGPAHHPEVGRLHEHERRRLGRRDGSVASAEARGGAVVLVAGVHRPVRPGERRSTVRPMPSTYRMAVDSRPPARAPTMLCGQRLALGRAETAQHRHPGMELHPKLVAGDLEDQLVEPHRIHIGRVWPDL